MRRILTLLTLLCLMLSPALAQDSAPPANPNASAAARAVLQYLYDLPNRGDNRFLTGQFGGFGDGQTVTLAAQHFEEATRALGGQPALTGWDLWNTDQSIFQSIEEAQQWAARYPRPLFTASVHFRNPWTGGGSADNNGWRTQAPTWTRFPITELVNTNTAAGATYHKWLDELAAGLQWFEDRGRVVLWRPFHEMNGGWFWWTPRTTDAAQFHALWRHMFDYFARVKGLDNLLWVYAPNVGFRDFDTFYPGAQYVDVIGLDYYKPLETAQPQLNTVGEYSWAVATGKPVYLSELGMRPSSGAGWNTYTYDYAGFLPHLRAQYPRLVGALHWEWIFRLTYPYDTNQRSYGQDLWSITADELPDFGEAPLPTQTSALTATPTRTPTRTPTQTAAAPTATPINPPTLTPTNTPIPPTVQPGCVEVVQRYVVGQPVGTPYTRNC